MATPVVLNRTFMQARRRELGLSQTAAAKRFGTSQPRWSSLEGGAETRRATLLAVATVLEVPYEDVPLLQAA
jgi:predicted transcriptional regulator